jgi:hypothetical protein
MIDKQQYIKIKPLTLKMKNRVKEHGENWEVIDWGTTTDFILIMPSAIKNPDKPYMKWVVLGKDVEIINEK